MEWISNKVQKPKRYGLYLVSNGYSWFIKLINQGVILQYDDLDDGYSCDPTLCGKILNGGGKNYPIVQMAKVPIMIK